MDRDEMKNRTKALALRVMKLIDHLPQNVKGRVLADQLMRSATSAAANYRAACRGRSRAEFISKVAVALEEADESLLWIELIVEGGLLPAERLIDLRNEADELCAILSTTWRSSKKQQRQILTNSSISSAKFRRVEFEESRWVPWKYPEAGASPVDATIFL